MIASDNSQEPRTAQPVITTIIIACRDFGQLKAQVMKTKTVTATLHRIKHQSLDNRIASLVLHLKSLIVVSCIISIFYVYAVFDLSNNNYVLLQILKMKSE